MVFKYSYPRAAVTVDAIIFALDGGVWHVLLVERASEPFRGIHAIPGGFVEMDETLEQAALRELEEETGIRIEGMTQLKAFDAVERDPRGRTISVAHYAVVNMNDHQPAAASDAASVGWFPLQSLPPLAFDHGEIIDLAIHRLVDREGA